MSFNSINPLLAVYFDPKEFQCPCCQRNGICQELIIGLDRLRLFLGRPIYVTSGYRCEAHNAKVGGTPHSQHLKGRAADIQTRNFEQWGEGVMDDFKSHIYRLGFRGLGIYSNFLHLDMRGGVDLITWEER